MTMTSPLEIGACTWSIDRLDPVAAVRAAGATLGLHVVQAGLFGEEVIRGLRPGELATAAREAGLRIACTFVAALPGEDFSSPQRVRETGGLGPAEAFPARLELIKRAAALTQELGCTDMGLHVGVVPSPQDASYAGLVERSRQVGVACAAHGVRLLLETGPEPAEALAGFLEALPREQFGVNFDPGNFIVYGTDDTVVAATRLKGRIGCVHMKDAYRAEGPAAGFGRAAPLGAGDANIPRVLSKLRAGGYAGPLMIEADTRVLGSEAIAEAARYLRSML